MNTEQLFERLFPDGEEAASYCARCKCAIPIDEWEVVGAASAFRHKGPLRFAGDPDRFNDPDDHGCDECGWIKRVPQKV